MEYVFLLGLVVGPWIMGFIYIIKLISGSNKRKETAKELYYLSDVESDPEKKKSYFLSAQYLSGKISVTPVPYIPYVPEVVDKPQDNEINEIFPPIPVNYVEEIESPVPEVATPQQNDESIATILQSVKKSNESFADHFKSLQNINILLYLGAFMIVVSAGIFVGFNYQSLSGTYKTTFLAIFALTFYLTGLVLYLKSTNIKEAGLTFLTIGLILFPLVGLAYYKFVSPGDGHSIWFVTSIVTAFFYALSLKLVKNSYLAYFVTFVSLSLFESFISLFDMPIYYFAWGMALSSIIFILVSKSNLKDPAFISSFKMSANYFLPISLIFSLFTMNDGLTGVGVNLLLAGTFYFVSSFLMLEKSQKEIMFTVAFVLFPLGILLILNDKHFSSIKIALIFGTVSLLYLIGYEKIRLRLEDNRPGILLTISSFMPIFLCFLFKINEIGMISTVSFVLLINAYCYYRSRQLYNLALSLIATLFLPNVMLVYFNNNSVELYSCIYFVISIAIFRLRIFARNLGGNEETVTQIAYVIPLIISVGSLFDSQNSLYATLILIGCTAFVYYLSYIEDKNITEFFTGILFYLTTAKLAQYLNLHDVNNMWVYFITGILLYLLSKLSTRKSKIFTYLGMVGPLISTVYVVISQMNVGTIYEYSSMAPLYLLLANLLFAYILSYLEDKQVFELVSIIIFYLVGLKLFQILDLSNIYNLCGFFIGGIILFALSMLPNRKSKLYLYGSMIGPFISAFAIFNTDDFLIATLLLLANVFYFYSISYLENRNFFEIITTILVYLTGIKFGQYLDLQGTNFIWVYIIAGVVLFVFGMLPDRKSKIFSYGGLIGPFAGAISGIPERSLIPICSLSVAGLMSIKMSYEEKSTFAKYISYGIFVVVLNWVLKYNNLTEMQYYTSSWAIFFGILSYLRHRSGDKEGGNATAVLGLAFLTIPTFYQSIFSDNRLIYALILGLESIALILVGIGINYKLILRWSMVFLIIDILYQSRNHISVIPKWMVIGIVGILILVGATYLLSKRSKEGE
jgi:hypothetical protein